MPHKKFYWLATLVIKLHTLNCDCSGFRIELYDNSGNGRKKFVASRQRVKAKQSREWLWPLLRLPIFLFILIEFELKFCYVQMSECKNENLDFFMG